jgi:hypothetical protein
MACRSLLNRILQAAEDERLIPANPVAKVPPPKRPVDPEVIFGRVEPRVYTPKQVGQLLAYAAPEDRGVLLVLAGTGLRAGELCGLLGVRVDLRRRRLEVATVRYDAGRFGRGYKPRPKSTAGIRSIPWPPWWSRNYGSAARRNGYRCCSRTHPATACGTPTCELFAGPGRTATSSA